MEKIGRYTVEKELGEGGMATVFIANDPRFQRQVAVKVLPREYLHNPQFRLRFEREAQTIAKLEHKAIVPVYDFGEENGQLFLVMRVMGGGDLVDRLEEKGSMSPQEIVPIISRIGSALDRAHKASIIHRDLKPGNILFDDEGEAYLADFGIAKLVEGKTNLTGTNLIGTPAYMSPEQARGEAEIDGRSDIYSLGAIIFEMLTGRLPFDAETAIGQAIKHITDPIPQLSDANPSLPSSLQDVINKAMAKNRDQRYQNGAELAAALRAAVEGRAPAAAVPKAHPGTVLLDRDSASPSVAAPKLEPVVAAVPPVAAQMQRPQAAPAQVAPQAAEYIPPVMAEAKSPSPVDRFMALSTGLKVGLVGGLLVMLFGLFSVLNGGDGDASQEEAIVPDPIATVAEDDDDVAFASDDESDGAALAAEDDLDDAAESSGSVSLADTLAQQEEQSGSFDSAEINPPSAETCQSNHLNIRNDTTVTLDFNTFCNTAERFAEKGIRTFIYLTDFNPSDIDDWFNHLFAIDEELGIVSGEFFDSDVIVLYASTANSDVGVAVSFGERLNGTPLDTNEAIESIEFALRNGIATGNVAEGLEIAHAIAADLAGAGESPPVLTDSSAGPFDPFDRLNFTPTVNNPGRYQFSAIENFTLIFTDTQTSMEAPNADPELGPSYFFVGTPIDARINVDDLFNEMLVSLVLQDDALPGFAAQISDQDKFDVDNRHTLRSVNFTVTDISTNQLAAGGRFILWENNVHLVAMIGVAPIDLWNSEHQAIFDAVMTTLQIR